MPILKYASGIHTAPKKFIEYIADTQKTDGAKLVTGINLPDQKEEAYKFMKRNFEHFSGLPFYVPQSNSDNSEKQKEKVRVHHYVQSFSPDEKLSAEEAHQICLEWAEKVFGNKYQVLVSTHIDKDHIHNHFAVSAYSLNGNQWLANLKSLRKCRRISDAISREHGLSIIIPRHRNSMKYNEWAARMQGTSIKQKLQMKIDELILSDDVMNIEQLAEKLRETGCEVRLGKFMTIKPPNSARAYRTDNLDRIYNGYSLKELEYRIINKDREFTDEAIKKFSGIQKTYALYMRSIQVIVYKRKSRKTTYYDLMKSVDLLNYLSEKNIHTVRELEDNVNKCDDDFRKQKNITETLKKRMLYLSQNENTENNKILDEITADYEAAQEKLKISAAERKQAGNIYKTYLRQISEFSDNIGADISDGSRKEISHQNESI